MNFYFKRIISVLVLLMCFFLITPKEVVAVYNTESMLYGFNIYEELYTVDWDQDRYSNVYYEANCIGTSKINIGKAILKEKVQGKTVITYLVAVKTSPKNPTYYKNAGLGHDKWTEYSHFVKCDINADLAEGTELINSFPKYEDSFDDHYQAFDPVNQGAIVNYTKKALEISNYSKSTNNTVNIKVHLNKSSFRWDWDIYHYAEQDNYQLFSFTVSTNNQSDFTQDINIYTEYETFTSNASFWADSNTNSADKDYSLTTLVRM